MKIWQENLNKYNQRQRREKIKVVAYMVAEAITAISIFAFGYLWFSLAI